MSSNILDAKDAGLVDLEHMLLVNDQDTSQAQILTERFIDLNNLRSNGHGDHASSIQGMSPIALVHDCYNSSYAIKVLASNMHLRPVVKLTSSNNTDVDTHDLPLRSDVNVKQIVTRLCVNGQY